MAKYICIEGLDGVGKSTLIKNLKTELENKGKKVFPCFEPGGNGVEELSLQLRRLALNPENKLDPITTELLFQASRSNFYHKVLINIMNDYDYVIQDRGALSGLSYGLACGNDYKFLETIIKNIYKKPMSKIYDQVIIVESPTEEAYKRSLITNPDFKNGDAMELKGLAFQETVKIFMNTFKGQFGRVDTIINNKSKEDLTEKALKIIEVL